MSNRQAFPQAQKSIHVRHYLIRGRVQGVGYRRFAEKRARDLEVGGWVRNLADGRVELVAEADLSGLDRFEEALRRGPIWAAVHELKASEITSDHQRDLLKLSEPGSFRVREDGETAVIEDLEKS